MEKQSTLSKFSDQINEIGKSKYPINQTQNLSSCFIKPPKLTASTIKKTKFPNLGRNRGSTMTSFVNNNVVTYDNNVVLDILGDTLGPCAREI